MNRILAMLAAGVMLAGMTSQAVAQDRGEGRRDRAASRPGDDRPLERLLKELNLTEEQQKQVQQIMDTQQQAVRNWRKENLLALKDRQKQLQDARKSGDEEKIKAARQEVEKIEQSRKALHDNVMKQLKGVLTPDQLEKAGKFLEQSREQGREQAREEHPGLRMLEGLKALDLTEDQKTRARAIFDDARKKADAATDPAEKELIMKVAREKIDTDVLNEQQREKIRRLAGANRLLKAIQKLNLTDDQKKQIAQIMADAKAQTDKPARGQEKRDISRQAFKKIFDTVLTDEQRKQFRDIMPKDNPREGRGRPGAASRPGATSRPAAGAPGRERRPPASDDREDEDDDPE